MGIKSLNNMSSTASPLPDQVSQLVDKIPHPPTQDYLRSLAGTFIKPEETSSRGVAGFFTILGLYSAVCSPYTALLWAVLASIDPAAVGFYLGMIDAQTKPLIGKIPPLFLIPAAFGLII